VGADPSDLLRRSGLRVTPQRLAVLRAVSEQPHASADAVLQAVKDEIGSISVQGVYDALAALTEKGLLRRIQPAGSPARYEDRVHDGHHHLVCRVCDRMIDVEGVAVDAPSGYEIEQAEVIYWGRCPECCERDKE